MKSLYFFIAIVFFFSSCSHSLLYVNNLQLPEDTLAIQKTQYKLKPYDYLYISIKSSNEKLNDFFSSMVSKDIGNSGNNGSGAQFYFNGFMLNDSGYVAIPWIGTFKLAGLTVEEAQQLIETKARLIAPDALVKVKLMSFRIYFIGEVKNSQTVFYQDKVNLLEALSTVGGVLPSGDKRNVYIIRRQGDKYVSYHMDLTDKNVFSSAQFYLQPDDIIYVKPRKSQVFRLSMQDYTFFVSVLTTTLSVVTLILTLTK